MNAERRMTDRQTDAAEREVHSGFEFNDLNIYLYLRLNYGTAPEHLKYSVRTLYGALLCFCGFPGA